MTNTPIEHTQSTQFAGDDQPSTWTSSQDIEKKLTELIHFESLISDFSSTLINLPVERIEGALKEWLEKLALFLQVDYASVLKYSADGSYFNRLQYYSIPDPAIPEIPDNVVVKSSFKSVIDSMSAGEMLVFENLPEDLPDALSYIPIIKADAKSFIQVPLASKDTVLGLLVLVNFRQKKQWPEDLVRRIRHIGEIIAGGLLRKENDTLLLKVINDRWRLEERYAGIIESANMGIMIIDQSHRILEVNDAYCRMTGYAPDEILSMTLSDLDTAGTEEKIIEIRDQIIAQKSLFLETRHRCKDGSIVDVEINGSYLHSEELLLIFYRDITTLKRTRGDLEERLHFEELISDFSASLINTTGEDLEDILDIWMAKLARYLNMDRCSISEYLDNYNNMRHIASYTHPDFSPIVRERGVIRKAPYGINRYSVRGKILKLNRIPEDIPPGLPPPLIELLIKTNTKSYLSIPFSIGSNLHCIMLFSSFTQENLWTDHLVLRLQMVTEMIASAINRDKLDKELTKYRHHLEQLVEERTVELMGAQKELLRFEHLAALGQLAATVSEELRHPLKAIREAITDIDNRVSKLNVNLDRPLTRAHRSVSRCNLIIDELKDYTQTQQVNRHPTPAHEWLNELLDEESPPAGISIERDIPVITTQVKIDKERLRRCLTNLLTNSYQAISLAEGKNGPGCVKISSRVRDDVFTITIVDNGVGFDPQEKEKLTEPLYSTKSFGVGLGMTIAKQVVEQHGGNITFVGTPGQGATMTIELPAT